MKNKKTITEEALRRFIRKSLFEMSDEILMDEERIPNDEAKEFVRNKENFIGSHIFGEKIGEDYVVCSYNEDFPIFIFDSTKKRWYQNTDNYVYDGEIIDNTEEHKEELKPTVDTHSLSLEKMLAKLHSMMSRAGIEHLSHTSVEPGTKN